MTCAQSFRESGFCFDMPCVQCGRLAVQQQLQQQEGRRGFCMIVHIG
jgi:hypothetical protein